MIKRLKKLIIDITLLKNHFINESITCYLDISATLYAISDLNILLL